MIKEKKNGNERNYTSKFLFQLHVKYVSTTHFRKKNQIKSLDTIERESEERKDTVIFCERYEYCCC